nr:hypothetical protein Iba_chr12cCG9550 [Ipomoea batatas]
MPGSRRLSRANQGLRLRFDFEPEAMPPLNQFVAESLPHGSRLGKVPSTYVDAIYDLSGTIGTIDALRCQGSYVAFANKITVMQIYPGLWDTTLLWRSGPGRPGFTVFKLRPASTIPPAALKTECFDPNIEKNGGLPLELMQNALMLYNTRRSWFQVLKKAILGHAARIWPRKEVQPLAFSMCQHPFQSLLNIMTSASANLDHNTAMSKNGEFLMTLPFSRQFVRSSRISLSLQNVCSAVVKHASKLDTGGLWWLSVCGDRPHTYQRQESAPKSPPHLRLLPFPLTKTSSFSQDRVLDANEAYEYDKFLSESEDNIPHWFKCLRRTEINGGNRELSSYPLGFPSEGKLQIWKFTRGGSEGLRFDFNFNPVLDLRSPASAFRFFFDRLGEVDSGVGEEIVGRIATFALEQVGTRNWICGLFLLVVLETVPMRIDGGKKCENCFYTEEVNEKGEIRKVNVAPSARKGL